jgi:hypothetical protein
VRVRPAPTVPARARRALGHASRALAVGAGAAALVILAAAVAPAQDSTRALRIGDRVRLTSAALGRPSLVREYFSRPLTPLSVTRPREPHVVGTLLTVGDSATVRTSGALDLIFGWDVPKTVAVPTSSITRWEASRGRRRAVGAGYGMFVGAVGGLLCGVGGGPRTACLVASTGVGTVVGALRAPDRWQRVRPPVTDSSR